jgi:hypothetical protein
MAVLLAHGLRSDQAVAESRRKLLQRARKRLRFHPLEM